MNDSRPSPPAWLQRIRDWLRSDMLVLRWVFLGLYLAIAGYLCLPFWVDDFDSAVFSLIFAGVILGCQALFLFGGGTMHLCRPIRKRRLWIPVAIAALMFCVLAVGLTAALTELFYLDDHLGDSPLLFWTFVGANWLFWFLVFFLAARRWRRMQVLSRITGALIAGSLAELLASVPSHMIVSRRPGCLVGLGTMLGILAGLYVMLFAFGPGIILLFLRPRYRREQMEDAPEPEVQWYQFSLWTLLVFVLVTGIGFGLIGRRMVQLWRKEADTGKPVKVVDEPPSVPAITDEEPPTTDE